MEQELVVQSNKSQWQLLLNQGGTCRANVKIIALKGHRAKIVPSSGSGESWVDKQRLVKALTTPEAIN